MKVEEVRAVTESLNGYEGWRMALDDAEEARQQRPKEDLSDPAYLRAQATMLDAQAAIAPATERLKVDVAEAGDLLALPFRIGLLRALDRNIAISKNQPQHRLLQVANMHFRGKSLDLDIGDYAFSSNDPFAYAVELGSAITEVEQALPRVKRTVATAVLRIGDNRRRSIVYTQPTVAEFHTVLVPEDRQLCEEPQVSDDHVDYALPKLAVSSAEPIDIPKVYMLELPNDVVDPRKLLLGKEVAKFAKKHAIDTENEQRAARVRAESHARIMRARIR